MSTGAIAAGVQVLLAVEADKFAAKTYAANHPTTRVFDRDIRTLSDFAIRKIPKTGNTSIVFGGPPCQGFSYSNQRTRSASNPENWLFLEFLRVVRVWRPDWVVFENVQGITNTAGGVFVAQVVALLEDLGYSACHGLLNAMDFGVPQDRKRFFLIGSRCAGIPALPTPSSVPPPTVNDAIARPPNVVQRCLSFMDAVRPSCPIRILV